MRSTDHDSEHQRHWSGLRGCWLDLKNPELQSFEETDFSLQLRQRHTDVLETLVNHGELDNASAEVIDAAFAQAIAHIQRQMATCYAALPAEFDPREDLTHQAAMLEEMAIRSDLDPTTVAQAQAALERDMTWLAEFNSGDIPGLLKKIEVSPASAKAARILVKLLLDQS